jgi:uncharacterized membrane protein YgcG
MIPPLPVWRCSKQVGFLFPHRCERISPVNCPDCQNGQVNDPYRTRTDRYGYDNDFDSYGAAETTGAAVGAFAFGGGDSGGGGASADFTEADGETLIKDDGGFEDDLSGS